MNTEEHRKKNPCISVFIRVYLWRSSFIGGVHRLSVAFIRGVRSVEFTCGYPLMARNVAP